MSFSIFARVSLRRAFTVAGLAIMTLCFMSPAQAALVGTSPVVPGTTIFLNAIPDSALPGTLLASLASPYSFSTTAGTTSGTLYSAVYKESGGTLDFYYQVANSAASATAIARETDTNFAGFLIALGYRLSNTTVAGGGFLAPVPSGAGAKTPDSGDLNVTGTTVGFSFNLQDADKIAPGQISTILAISTNATNFTNGNAAVIDGGTQTVASFQPAAATGVPEPASMILIGAGLIALAGISRFRKA